MSAALTPSDAQRLEQCVTEGGVAVFPTDTVYGVCCDPESEDAARKLYSLKGRAPRRACAVMFFDLEPALRTLDELSESERLALQALLPGPVTVLVRNPSQRFAPACRKDPASLGVRVPLLPESLAALRSVGAPVMQSSANLSGEADARSLSEVPVSLREGADLVLDGGELPGTPSTVVDLREFDSERRWHVLREGALGRSSVESALAALAALA
jgi:L-threonylcarbamoyladenylate synthase